MWGCGAVRVIQSYRSISLLSYEVASRNGAVVSSVFSAGRVMHYLQSLALGGVLGGLGFVFEQLCFLTGTGCSLAVKTGQ